MAGKFTPTPVPAAASTGPVDSGSPLFLPPSPHDPFRPVDWRWLRANWLCQRRQGRPGVRGRHQGSLNKKSSPVLPGPADEEDPYVVQAKRYLLAYQRLSDEIGHQRLSSRQPGLYYAHLLWRNTTQNDRWTVEARLLAKQTIHDIAKKQRTTTEVIFWFEKLFFDVADHLEHRDYVVHRVLGAAASRGIHERDYDLLLKIYALVGGPLAVDSLVYMTSRDTQRLGAMPSNEQELAAFWTEDQADTLRRKAAISARTMPINSHTQSLILDAHHKLLELEAEKDERQLRREAAAGLTSGNSSQRLLLEGIASCLSAVPFHTASGLESGRNVPTSVLESAETFKGHDRSAVELHAHELIALGTGNTPNIDDLELYRFPEQQNKVQ